MWRSGAGLGRALKPESDWPSRHHGMGARLKYSAICRASMTTLTTLGLVNSSNEPMACAAVLMLASGRSVSTRATSLMSAGGISGSSPCTLTTTASGARPSSWQASARRSLPLTWSFRVSKARMPCASQAATMRSSSAATTTRLALDSMARCATRTTMGSPAISARGLSGKRLEAMRAGMTTVKPAAEPAGGEKSVMAGAQSAGRRAASFSISSSLSVRASFSSRIGMPLRTGYARRALRESSSWCSRSKSRGPLVTGQTSNSSNLLSMLSMITAPKLGAFRKGQCCKSCSTRASSADQKPFSGVMTKGIARAPGSCGQSLAASFSVQTQVRSGLAFQSW